MNILNALWPILLALLAGVAFGRLAPAPVNRRLIGLIAPLIWLMLFLTNSVKSCSRPGRSARSSATP